MGLLKHDGRHSARAAGKNAYEPGVREPGRGLPSPPTSGLEGVVRDGAPGGSRKRARARRGRRAGSPPTYLPVDEAASGELVSNAQGAKGIRARLGARRSQGESAALSL